MDGNYKIDHYWHLPAHKAFYDIENFMALIPVKTNIQYKMISRKLEISI